MKYVLILIGILSINILISQENTLNSINQVAENSFNKAKELKYKSQDSAIALFNKSYNYYLKSNDTLGAVYSLLEKSELYGNNAEYANSYDAIWAALILSDNVKNDILKSTIYTKLGRVYSYYKRENQSLKFLMKALHLQKMLLQKDEIKSNDLVPYYYNITATYRELGRHEIAKKYLDSVYLNSPNTQEIIPLPFIEFEKANIFFHKNSVEEALKIMNTNFSWFKKNEPAYLVLYYKYWADMHLKTGNLDISEDLYKKAISTSKKYQSHKDFTPLIYEKLTELYLLQNDYSKAFNNLKIAKDLDRQFFDSRSPNNRKLLEIKDTYQLEKEKQENLIKEQYLKQLEQEDKIKRLQLTILMGSIIFLVIIGINVIKNIRSKHKAEKTLINRKNELEIQKNQELLELKNKELASSALQLIEKDEFLKNIKTIVRAKDDKPKIHEINKALRTVSMSNNHNWEEFKHRFIDVNKQFYDKIIAKYPNLSQNDQKICALIKLNFPSKEMSRLLGISVESVHTSRHRLRKKMNLSRDVNLEDYINNL